MRMSDERSSGIQVIARAAAILRTLENHPGGLSLGEIAIRVNLPRSTVQRIVGALEVEQIVSTGRANGGVRLGPALIRLAVSAHTEVSQPLRQNMTDLALRVDENVNLSELRGRHVFYLDEAQPTRQFRFASLIGTTMPSHCTANGKALLAQMSDDAVTRLIGQKLVRHTATTTATLPGLLKELAEIRKSGIAIDRNEYIDGICAVGTVVRDATGEMLALAIPVQTERFHQRVDTLCRELVDCREAIEGKKIG